MKHLKVLIPSVVVLLAFVAWSQITVSTEHIDGLYEDVFLDELADESELVIIGTFNSQKVESNPNGPEVYPLRSKTNVNVLEVLKGNYTGSTLDIISAANGITYKDGYRTEVIVGQFLVEYVPGEKMFLFLVEDPGNVIGDDGYFVLGSGQGAYNINMNNATNPHYPERNTTVQDIRNKLS